MKGDRASATLGGDYPKLFDGRSVAGLGVAELLDRFVARRDEAAFEALVTRLGPMVLGVCRRMLADPHDVDDAFQATFLVLVRRAGTIRDADLAATWLYEVAVRVASQARLQAIRRSNLERRSAVAEARESPPPLDGSEVRAAIDEEIGRLPEHHRRAVVLCDVEGLTREEAAARLGWTVNMVRGRLDRARGRLRDRLTRRGLAPSGAWLALAPMAPRAALIAMTVRAVGVGAVSASAMSLCRGVLRMMIFSKVKLVACLMLSMAVVAGMAVTVEGQKPDAKAAPGTDGVAESLDVQISGMVRDHAGKPVAGATVHVVGSKYPEKILSGATHVVGGSATTGEDGRYLLPAARLPINRPSKRQPHSTPYVDFQVVAKTPGLAIGWHDRASMYAVPNPDPADKQPRLAMNAPVEMDVSLRPESELKGRVVDEAGQPVAGVKVVVVSVSLIDAQGAEMRSSGYLDPDLLPDGVGRATTDADGRFRLPGLPSESCCHLSFKRPGSNSSRGLYASTSAKAETTHAFDVDAKRARHQALPADMAVSMPTTRMVEVRIVAEDDGKPMAGVPVLSLDETISPGISAGVTTDVEGKITFDLPPGSYDGFTTFPDLTEDSKYVGGRLTPFVVAPEPARQAMEFKMERGGEVLIEVVDSETGQGIPGIRFKVIPESHPDGSYRLHGSGTVYDPNGQLTDADGKIRAVFVPSRKETYRVRVIGVGSLTPGSYAGPGLPSEALPYDAIKAQSDPFTPTGGKPLTLRFVLKKR